MTPEIKEFLKIFADDIKSDDVSLFLFRDSSPESPLELVAAGHHKKLEELAVPRTMGIVGWVATNGEPVLSNDTTHNEHFSDAVDMISGFETHSILAVPIRYEGILIGVLEAINKSLGGDFSEEDLKLAQKAAEQLADQIPPKKLLSLIGK